MSLGLILIDMDDTIADFGASPVFGEFIDDSKMYEPGFFRDLKPVDGALVAVRKLAKLGFEIQICTQPVAQSPHCYAEKTQWIGMYFPELIPGMNMVQDKGLMKADYLIDDNLKKWKSKFEKNGGKFIHFPYVRKSNNHKAAWEQIVKYFENVAEEKNELNSKPKNK